MFFQEFYNWGCDFLVFEIFQKSKQERIIDMWELVEVNHYNHFSQFEHLKRPIDNTLKRTQELARDPVFGCHKPDVWPLIVEKYLNLLDK